MLKQLSLDRQIHPIFPVALAALLVVGLARLVLDDLKSHGSFVFKMYGRPRSEKHRLPVLVSKEDLVDDECNLFEGKWLWDNASYPLYEEETCPFLVKQVTCQKNGRPDSFYKKWRWQPNSCNLPRFANFFPCCEIMVFYRINVICLQENLYWIYRQTPE